MKILHLVKVRFDKRGPQITQEWLEKRFRFFIENTYQSLIRQTTEQYVLWINCQAGMEEEVATLNYYLPESRAGKSPQAIFSFGDDPPSLDLLPDNMVVGVTHIYITRIDSDDLFAPDALECVARTLPQKEGRVEGLLFHRGYLHDMVGNRVGVYNSPSPPFHTIIFPVSVFRDRGAYASVWERVGDHSRVAKELPCQKLPDWKFSVLIHENNFLSTWNYGRESGYVPKGWTIDQFLQPPIIFDVDDFSNTYGGDETLSDLFQLRERYPNFKCTLFTIPNKTNELLQRTALGYPWIELAVHGWDHHPTEELKKLSAGQLTAKILRVRSEGNPYAEGFRPPGWYIMKEHCEALSGLGMWIALHKRDIALARYCKSGYYICGDRFPYWHGHTHDVCGNYLRTALPDLMKKWPRDQKFGFVSEAALIPSR